MNIILPKSYSNQGSILRPLLFLLYVNDSHHALMVLNPTVFADDTNLFFSHSEINVLFEKMNKECKYLASKFLGDFIDENLT